MEEDYAPKEGELLFNIGSVKTPEGVENQSKNTLKMTRTTT
jgi:hypothetical protein